LCPIRTASLHSVGCYLLIMEPFLFGERGAYIVDKDNDKRNLARRCPGKVGRLAHWACHTEKQVSG
jgi:hypothetical protein